LAQTTSAGRPAKPHEAESSAPTETAAPSSASPAAPAATPSATAPGVPAPAARSFPPPDIAPPHPKSAADGDGRWKPLGAARTKTGAPLLASTTLHPHKASAFATLLLVAIDLDATRLGFVPGVDDVRGKVVPFAPGLVPSGDRERLVAVFNGGFLPRHGRWGMRAGSVTVLPPRPDGCTIAIHADGAVEIRSFSHLASRESTFAAVRQTPPCLVERGAVHADLSTSRTRAWGGQTPGIVTRRRSAIGLSADGRTLYYAIGVETPPRLLAEGLAAAGVHDAAELDINWNWTRFFTFEKSPEGTPEVATVLADVEHTKRDYVSRASERDFFFVLRETGK
jgi:hypothetical protein